MKREERKIGDLVTIAHLSGYPWHNKTLENLIKTKLSTF